ncbi:hypothetical protein U3A55_08330 [Salarchaeum sp. III]|uniref:hypothetical protein n=1 Tax=Salarchaeum sp. III TaxID=3107927 RepID=UPI002ED94D26
MARRLPGIIERGDGVDEARASTEVLASAFDTAAGGFFERRASYEDDIADAEDRRDRMRKLGAGGVAIGVLVLVAGVFLEFALIGAVVGVLTAAASAAYAYREYQNAEDAIEDAEQNLAENEPDGSVSFISQVTYPFHLVPYGDRHMIFDGRNAAPVTDLELANVDGAALADASSALADAASVYDDGLSDAGVLDPAVASEIAPGVREHGRLEKPLTDEIDRMAAIARDLHTESVQVRVHANDTVSNSLSTAGDQGTFLNTNELPAVETTNSLAESENVVSTIRGLEEQATSGDLLDEARAHRDRVDSLSRSVASRLQQNERVLTEHFDAYERTLDQSVKKHVDAAEHADRLAAIDDELDLTSEILSPDSGSLGTALSDRDLDRLDVDGEGSFTEQIRADIENRIPTLNDDLADAYTTAPDIGPDGTYDRAYDGDGTHSVHRDGVVFGEVWRSLFYSFREPIMDSVDDLERDAEDIRQNKEQKMIDVSQFEQMKDAAEREYSTVKSEYEAARTVEEEL